MAGSAPVGRLNSYAGAIQVPPMCGESWGKGGVRGMFSDIRGPGDGQGASNADSFITTPILAILAHSGVLWSPDRGVGLIRAPGAPATARPAGRGRSVGRMATLPALEAKKRRPPAANAVSTRDARDGDIAGKGAAAVGEAMRTAARPP